MDELVAVFLAQMHIILVLCPVSCVGLMLNAIIAHKAVTNRPQCEHCSAAFCFTTAKPNSCKTATRELLLVHFCSVEQHYHPQPVCSASHRPRVICRIRQCSSSTEMEERNKNKIK